MSPSNADPLRLGIVGLGRRGAYHLERLSLRDDCRAVALFDSAPLSPGAPAVWTGRLHSTWNEFLADPRIEVVLIATPTSTHQLLVCEALSAGKHVAVEKPLCCTVAESSEIERAAARASRFVSVINPRRGDSDFRTALDQLNSGKLGPLTVVKWILRQFSPIVPPVKGAGKADRGRLPSPRDGALLDFGAHAFDQLLQLVDSSVISVSAKTGISRWSPGVDDGFTAWIRFASGVDAQIEVSLSSLAPLETGWYLCGETGAYASGKAYRATDEGELVEVKLDPLPTEQDGYYAALARHVRDGDWLPSPLSEAQRVITLIEKVRDSAASGELIRGLSI